MKLNKAAREAIQDRIDQIEGNVGAGEITRLIALPGEQVNEQTDPNDEWAQVQELLNLYRALTENELNQDALDAIRDYSDKAESNLRFVERLESSTLPPHILWRVHSCTANDRRDMRRIIRALRKY